MCKSIHGPLFGFLLGPCLISAAFASPELAPLVRVSAGSADRAVSAPFAQFSRGECSLGFHINYEGTPLLFVLDGGICEGGREVGRWNVNQENQIFVEQGKYAGVIFQTAWKLENNTDLVLLGEDNTRALYRFTIGAEDVVVNDADNAITASSEAGPAHFKISPQFFLDRNKDLIVRIGGNDSKLDGVLEGNWGRFAFRFVTKDTVEKVIRLNGRWERDLSKSDRIALDFVYLVAGAEKRLEVPGSFSINEFTGNLRLTYLKYEKTRFFDIPAKHSFSLGTNSEYLLKVSLVPRGATSSEFVLEAVLATDKAPAFQTRGRKEQVSFQVLDEAGRPGEIFSMAGGISAVLGTAGYTLIFTPVFADSRQERVRLFTGAQRKNTIAGCEFTYKAAGTARSVNSHSKAACGPY